MLVYVLLCLFGRRKTFSTAAVLYHACPFDWYTGFLNIDLWHRLKKKRFYFFSLWIACFFCVSNGRKIDMLIEWDAIVGHDASCRSSISSSRTKHPIWTELEGHRASIPSEFFKRRKPEIFKSTLIEWKITESTVFWPDGLLRGDDIDLADIEGQNLCW